MAKCSVETCENEAFARTWCRLHYDRMRDIGQLDPVRISLTGKICTVEGCDKPVRGKGLCNNHYQRLRKYGRVEKVQKPSKTIHPYYHIWFERKQNKDLAWEWLDFWRFVADVGEKPEGHYFLVKKSVGLYGPNNFEWKEKLKQEQSETDKEWWARKWQDKIKRNPDIDYERNLQRKYGITIDDYNRMLTEQDGKCGICGREETRIANGKGTRLSVDHCHQTNKVRGLLCFACNSTLGKYDDKIDFLKAMINYLDKHKEEENGN